MSLAARFTDAERVCGKCGSDELGWKMHAPDYGRKECYACGSTGPFVPAATDGGGDQAAAPKSGRGSGSETA